jgi:hypothetical protein
MVAVRCPPKAAALAEEGSRRNENVLLPPNCANDPNWMLQKIRKNIVLNDFM